MATLLTLAPLLAQAQWVMVGRKAMGAIQNVRSEHSDVATVLLEAPADKVYAAALRTMDEKEGVRIKGQDDAARTIDFSRGRLIAKMKVGRVDDKVSMITVSSPGTIRKSGDPSAVVDAILRTCHKMGVECHEAKE
jgi:hypothetical protein